MIPNGINRSFHASFVRPDSHCHPGGPETGETPRQTPEAPEVKAEEEETVPGCRPGTPAWRNQSSLAPIRVKQRRLFQISAFSSPKGPFLNLDYFGPERATCKRTAYSRRTFSPTIAKSL